MTEPAEKEFDCVKFMRERRDFISEAIAEMGWSEVNAWIRNQPISDPQLRKLMEDALGAKTAASESAHAAEKA